MNNKGFYVGDGREKCRQQFVNLQQAYTKYIDRRRSTGEGKIKKPLFFDQMDDLLGYKEKSNPSFLLDSVPNYNKNTLRDTPVNNDVLPTTISTSSQDIASCSTSPTSPTTSSNAPIVNIKNRFTPSGVKASVQPKRHEYLEKFYTLSEKSEDRKKEEFKAMMDLIRYEQDKKHEQMMALISSLSKKKSESLQKRKRDSSDSD